MIVRYSQTARRQLIGIWRYSRHRWGEARADKYVKAIYDTARMAADGKRRARPRPEIQPGLSSIACGSHHIYLALDADADVMHVVAVLHQRMEPRRHIMRALKGSEDHGPY